MSVTTSRLRAARDAAKWRTKPGKRIAICHPSPDVYGSDLQLLESVAGLCAEGWDVTVFLPASGPLVPRLDEVGATTSVVDFPVLRRTLLSVRGLLVLLLTSPIALWRLWRLIRRERPDVVYVNTVTIPTWLFAARLAGRKVICHVHEAEETQHRFIRTGLNLPLLLAHTILTNSKASERVLLDTVPALGKRTTVVYNGITGPETTTDVPTEPTSAPHRLALIGRLSPRKGTDVALDALAQLLTAGRSIHLDICGSIYPGYEWFETQLRTRASQPDLAGHVTFHGYVNPTWPLLDQASIVLVPSRTEPFGNTAVEGLLARRPVIASNVQGLAEIITDNHNGILVPPEDPTALAEAITTLLDNPDHAAQLANTGHHEATTRYTPHRYRTDILTAVNTLTGHDGPVQKAL